MKYSKSNLKAPAHCAPELLIWLRAVCAGSEFWEFLIKAARFTERAGNGAL